MIATTMVLSMASNRQAGSARGLQVKARSFRKGRERRCMGQTMGVRWL